MSIITNRDLFALTLRYAMESDLEIERYAKYKGEKTPSLFGDDDKPSWITGGGTATKSSDWDESKHPRVEKGSKAAHGGQFTKAKQQSLAGLTMAETVGKVGEKKDDRKKPEGIESNEKLPLFEQAAKVFEESARKQTKPDDSMKPIPLRERKAYAESLAKGGMLQTDIADHLMERGIASVDARRLASDATFAASVPSDGDSESKVNALKSKLEDHKKHIEKLVKEGMSHFDIVDEMEKRGMRLDDAKLQETIIRQKHNEEQAQSGGVGKKPNSASESPAMGDKPGIVMPSKTIPNEEAKPGDQLGLFGEAVKAPKTTFKPKLLEQQAKQGGLFDTKGNPDQMDLFGDGVMPDDMVYKPEAKKDVDADSIAKMAPGAIKRSEREQAASESGLSEAESNRKWAENHITIAADDITKLRKQDVYRVLENAPNDKRGYLENWIQKRRPDLAQQVNEDSQEIDAERANAKPAASTAEPTYEDLQKNPPWGDKPRPANRVVDEFAEGKISENHALAEIHARIDKYWSPGKGWAKMSAHEKREFDLAKRGLYGMNWARGKNAQAVEQLEDAMKSLPTLGEVIDSVNKNNEPKGGWTEADKVPESRQSPKAFKPKLASQKKSDEVASKPDTLLSPDELSNPGSVPKAKDDSFTYGDAVKTPSGKVGIMSGSGGMGSDRVGVN